MQLIGILAALGLEHLLAQVPGWGQPVLFLGYVRGLRRALPSPALWSSWAAPFVLMVPPVALVWWIGTQLANPFLDLGFAAGILLLCLGPRDLAEDIHQLQAARAADDTARVQQLSRALRRGPGAGESGRTLIGALFIQSHERLFGVLLWFFVAGPAGAVAYRFASRLPRALGEQAPDSPAQHAADLVHNALAYVPARITALLYGLAGSLDDALGEWRRHLTGALHEWQSRTWALLAEVPAASLGVEDGAGTVVPVSLDAALAEVLRMQRRALLILLAFFAFFATGSML